MRRKPIILKTEVIASSRLFKVEQLNLRFANGEERCYERLQNRGLEAVMIVPFVKEDTVLLVREYAAGVERYELGLPKGLVDKGEDIYTAANRELMEEVGYGAKHLQLLTTLTAAPGYMNSSMQVFLAQDLYPEKLPGDEPEELEVVPWSLSRLNELITQEDITEARSIAALFIAREYLQQNRSKVK